MGLRDIFGKTPTAMRLVALAETKAILFSGPLCDSWIAYDVPDLAMLTARLREMQRGHPDCRVLTSLDDLGQASYTSGHAIDRDGLDLVYRSKSPQAPADWFEDGEDMGFLKGPESFAYRLANLRKAADKVDFADLEDFLPWSDPDTPGNDPVSLNTAPDSFLQLAKEPDMLIQLVPVAAAADALAAFPNGYFRSDLQPGQTMVLARLLEDRHGLGLFGVGASTLGFWREIPLPQGEARDVAALIGRLYHAKPGNWLEDLSDALTRRDALLLRYSGS